MTKQEYAEYQERVSQFLKGVESVSTGFCSDCPECGNYPIDSWFSWLACEICGSEAGNREPWHGLIDGKLIHGECCEDCAYYLNYGQLDDKTMSCLE